VDGSGNLFLADTDNHCVRKVAQATGLISTVAGAGGQMGYTGDDGLAVNARLSSPAGISVDAPGNLFIADQGNHRIRVVSVYDNKIRRLAGYIDPAHPTEPDKWDGFNGDDRPAVGAKLYSPADVSMAAVRGGRQIYIADTTNNRIRRLSFQRIREVY
jgi:hypothetical protein